MAFQAPQLCNCPSCIVQVLVFARGKSAWRCTISMGWCVDLTPRNRWLPLQCSTAFLSSCPTSSPSFHHRLLLHHPLPLHGRGVAVHPVPTYRGEETPWSDGWRFDTSIVSTKARRRARDGVGAADAVRAGERQAAARGGAPGRTPGRRGRRAAAAARRNRTAGLVDRRRRKWEANATRRTCAVRKQTKRRSGRNARKEAKRVDHRNDQSKKGADVRKLRRRNLGVDDRKRICRKGRSSIL